MHARTEDLTGKIFGHLTVLRFAGSDMLRAFWFVRCACGTEKKIPAAYLKKGTDSCGCMTRKRIAAHRITHGHSKEPIYAVWFSMIARCYRETHEQFKNYGARGISVCEKWTLFEGFFADMGPSYKPGLSLDRKDNNGNYEKDNCRWVTIKAQLRNKRTTRYIDTPWGRISVGEAAEKSGIKYSTLMYRLDHGISEDKLFIPQNLKTI